MSTCAAAAHTDTTYNMRVAHIHDAANPTQPHRCSLAATRWGGLAVLDNHGTCVQLVLHHGRAQREPLLPDARDVEVDVLHAVLFLRRSLRFGHRADLQANRSIHSIQNFIASGDERPVPMLWHRTEVRVCVCGRGGWVT